MLKRGIVGLIALVFAILACGVVVSMAQRSATVYASPPQDQLSTRGRSVLTVRSDDDPMVAVDSFLSRNRKEADLSINNLTKEAEALRARLQKVEEALARWQTVSEALNHGSDPVANGPGPKPSARNWRRQPTPESVPPLPPPQPGPESPAGLTPPLSEPEPAFLPRAKEGPTPVLIPPPSGAEELPLPKAEY